MMGLLRSGRILRLSLNDALGSIRGWRSCTPGRGLEVEVEVVLRGVADEGPVVEEAAVVDVAEVVQDHPAGRTEAGRHLEEVDQLLRRQPAGPGLGRQRASR